MSSDDSENYDDEKKSDGGEEESTQEHSLLDDVPPAKNVGRKRTIDETKLSEEEAKKLATRRAYNRQCAAKARKRNKDLVSHLQIQVEDLTREKNELQRTNEVMRAQMNLLEETNRSLLLNQMANGGAGGGAGGGLAGLSALAGASQLLGAAPGLAAGMQGLLSGGGAGTASSSLLDHLTMERIAAQNRIQALRQASQGGMDGSNSNNNAGNLNSKQGFFR